MQPLTGEFTEEKIDSEVKYGDHILVFHKTQGQMPIRFVGVDKEYLFFRDIDETQNLYSVMDGKIYLKDIDRIEGIKRSEIATSLSLNTSGDGDWEVFPGDWDWGQFFLRGVLPLVLLLALIP